MSIVEVSTIRSGKCSIEIKTVGFKSFGFFVCGYRYHFNVWEIAGEVFEKIKSVLKVTFIHVKSLRLI